MTTQIPLAPDLVPLILSGKKTSTVRLGIRNYPVGSAEIVSGSVQIPIMITEITYTKVRCLDQQIARSEGYDSIEELLSALKRFYPRAGIDSEITVVRFHQL